jgi:hypothetical protein
MFYKNLFKMICEILNSYRDTYVNLHCIMTLCAYFRTFLNKNDSKSDYIEFFPSIRVLLIKLANPNIGLSDTAAVYLGHSVILYFRSNDEL